MTTLKDRIHNDKIASMKSRDARAVCALNEALQAIATTEHATKNGSELNDEQVQDVVKRIVKSLRASQEQYAGITEGPKAQFAQSKAEEIGAEIAVLSVYLPEEMSDDEVRRAVVSVVDEMGADSSTNIGMVMKNVMPVVGKRADGKKVKSVVADVLSTR